MRILVIEDEQKVSALVKRGLTAERYAVDITADGVEGLEYFEAFPYDLVILDLMLPRVSGFNVARVLRAHDRTRRAAIVAVTALTSETFRAEALDAGCDSVLRKPLIGATVVAEIMRLLAKRRNPQASTPPKL